MPASHSTRKPTLHLYARISSAEQRKGRGIERQTSADVESFCREHGFIASKTILIDDGVSAFKGRHLTPTHALGKFLADATRRLIPPGDCLLIENWDRLSRQNVWAAIGLVNELRQCGIHIGRLDRGKLLRADSDDIGDFFEAALELMRGNSESKAKSMRATATWKAKRAAARKKSTPLTRRLPAWIEERDGKLHLRGAPAATVRRIFDLACEGLGIESIAKRLQRENVPAFGKSGHWVGSYIGKILADRRAIGEYQPRCRGRDKEGSPIPNYFPAVVTEQQFHAARDGANARRNIRGRLGKTPNVFAGLLRCAHDGTSYILARSSRGQLILKNQGSRDGLSPCRTFPFACFESALLQLLREINPAEILGQSPAVDETAAVSGEITATEEAIAAIEAELDRNGESPTLYRRLRAREDRLAELGRKLSQLQQANASPLSESWGAVHSLAEALEVATDPEAARLRLRMILRRITEGITVLVVPSATRPSFRAAAVQLDFQGGGRRSVLILHSAPGNGRKGGWWARSLASAVADNEGLDLRNRTPAERLEAALQALDLAVLTDDIALS
ncbi:MAG TPA: recombinase family protein [Gemmataceae bacterium]|nr:recombinase family protein [Gemmataceae bacterium]